MNKIACKDNFGNIHYFEESEFVPRTSAYGLYIKDDEILMVQDAWAKKWELPGGGIENTEEIVDGMAREFFEETGLKTNSTHCKFLFEHESKFFAVGATKPWSTKRLFYLVTEAEGHLRSQGNGDDVIAARFIASDQLNSIDIKAENLEIIKHLLNLI